MSDNSRGAGKAKRGSLPSGIVRPAGGTGPFDFRAAGASAGGGLFRTPKTAQIIARYFRQKIISGELPAGSRLPVEPDLIRELGVSRTILREALRILESESLLQVSRGSRNGAVVLRPDPRVWAEYANVLLQLNGATVADVYAARQAIEAIAAGLLARNATAGTIAALEEALEAEARGLAEGPEAYIRPSAEFHDLVGELCGNKTLAVLVMTLNEIIRHQMVAVRLPENPDQALNNKRAHRTHAKLVEHVKARDAAAAQDLWQRHHEGAARVILRDHGDRTVLDLMAS